MAVGGRKADGGATGAGRRQSYGPTRHKGISYRTRWPAGFDIWRRICIFEDVMKKQILLLLLVVAACKPEARPGGDFFGTIAEESIASGWEQDARISVFDGNSGNSEYAYAGEASAKSGKFTAKELSTEGIALSGRYGVYPYMSSTIATNAGLIYVELPQVQEGVPG